MEFVNNASLDANGNILVYVFAPGKYIVSSQSISGTQGNMDVDALIEMFATPTPEPTPEPTPTLEPTPAPTLEVVDDKASVNMVPILLVLLVVLGAALIITVIAFKAKNLAK